MSEGAVSYDLDKLLADARDADPSIRIELRDALVGHGEQAIEAMTEWLGDPRLAAFAIRVLERIGREAKTRDAVLEVLTAVDREELPPHLAGDVDRALEGLGRPKANERAGLRRSGVGGSGRPLGTPGVDGRGYWVMRTSQWERPYIWAEAQRGRLRQGWGWNAEMNLDTIAEVVRGGGEPSDEQRMAWRSRRMRTTAPDGMRIGDILVAPNIPVWGVLSVFRITGSYEYSLDAPRQWDERFGHVLPVELLVTGIDRRSPKVSDGLRSMLRVQTRLYNISGYGGDVERLLGNHAPTTSSDGDRQGELWMESEYETLFGRFPPTSERPTDDQVAALAAELGRTFDAISWQWGDGKAYCSGASASTTSDPLKAWLDRTGTCAQ
jgi:hypothetical protein